MRWLFFWVLLATITGFLPAGAQDNVVQEFSGTGSTTTGLFKVQDRWEVRWNARQVVSVAVMSADGTIVAGAAGVLRGSLFVPLGGQYYLKISDGTAPPPTATNAPAASTNAPPATTNAPPATTNAPPASTNAPPAATNAPPASTNAPPASTNAPPASTNAPAASTNAPPTPISQASPFGSEMPAAATNTPPPASTNAPTASTNTPAANPPPASTDSFSMPQPETPVSWHVQIVQLGTSVDSNQALTVYTPFFMVPDSAITPVAPPPEPPPPVLTDEQVRAVVTIKGDKAQGAGFLIRSPDGLFVATHLHLLAANPNVKIFTNSGAPITTLSLKGAVDRDLALFAVQDDHLSCLPLATDSANSVEAGDQVIIPDIGQQAEVLFGKPGKVIGLGPERIDFDNAMGPNSSGTPVIHVKSGRVLAMVTAEKQVDVSEVLAKAWPANPAPGSASIIPYFGLRLTAVQGWETYDQPRFLSETLALKQFHRDTRCLDSYLNGRRRRARGESEEDGPPDNRYFLNNIKLRGANDNYRRRAYAADRSQQLDAARELLFDLESVADTGMSTLQGMTILYSYDRIWAQEELAYRKALKNELDDLSNNIVRLDRIARSH